MFDTQGRTVGDAIAVGLAAGIASIASDEIVSDHDASMLVFLALLLPVASAFEYRAARRLNRPHPLRTALRNFAAFGAGLIVATIITLTANISLYVPLGVGLAMIASITLFRRRVAAR